MTLTRQVRVWAGRGPREGSGANPGLSRRGAGLAAALFVRPPPLPPRRAARQPRRRGRAGGSTLLLPPPAPLLLSASLWATCQLQQCGGGDGDRGDNAPESDAPASGSRTPESRSVPGGGSTVPSDEPLGATYQSAVKGLKLEIWRPEGSLGRAHRSSAQGGLQWAGEEPVSGPALCQAPSAPRLLCPFNSCLPHLGSGWYKTLYLALLGRLQVEAEAVASSTLGFPDIIGRKSQTHIERPRKGW
jgi:hypothetical protein